MAVKVDTCAQCKQVFQIRVMRYVKQADGTYKYLCNGCRKQNGLPTIQDK